MVTPRRAARLSADCTPSRDDRCGIGGGNRLPLLVGVGGRQIEQLPDQPRRAVDPTCDLFERVPTDPGIIRRQRDLRLCLQPGEWRLQLVGGKCCKTLLPLPSTGDAAEQAVDGIECGPQFAGCIGQIDRTQIVGVPLAEKTCHLVERAHAALHRQPDQEAGDRQDERHGQQRAGHDVIHQRPANLEIVADHDLDAAVGVQDRVDAPGLAIDRRLRETVIA